MNLEFFIAKRLIKGNEHKSSISAPIIKIAIAAIALGIIMMLIAIATSIGFKQKIREKVSAFNGHIQIYNYDNNNSEVSVHPITKNQPFYPDFKSVEGITHINIVATKGGIIRTENTFEGIIAKGVEDTYNWTYFKEYLIAGKLPNYSGDLSMEVLVSDYLAKRLALKVGSSFFTFFLKNDGGKIPNQRKFVVSGIYDSGFQEFDSNYMFIDLRNIQRMNKWTPDQIGNFEIYIDNFDQIEEKGKEIYGKTVHNLDTQTIKSKFQTIFEWLELFDFNVALIIGIMIIVGGINMITALLVLILERTQMIGVLKALGANNWSIRKVFMYNAVYLITIGLFWGNLIGIGLLLIQKYFGLIQLDPSQYYVSQAPVYLDLGYILILNIGVLVLCMLMLIIPSFVITRVSPIKAMKFD